MTATSIRITLNRINTFGDEVFSDSKVLKSYYYAISDFAVGGRYNMSFEIEYYALLTKYISHNDLSI